MEGRGSKTKKTRLKDEERTKVVIRKLPPSISQSLLFSRIDPLFSHRYTWSAFRPGSEKRKKYSRAYMVFRSPEDVLDFADFFNGHLFVTDKGAHFRAVVEYAPCQRIPKPSTNEDGREGTIYTDPEYLEFLKLIAKPVEDLLPRVGIQLQTNEAARPGLVVTPLMEYVRQKRALKAANQGSLSAIRIKKPGGRKVSGATSSCAKRATDKKKIAKKAKKSNSSQNGNSATRNGEKLSDNGSGVQGSSEQLTLTSKSGKKALLSKKKKKDATPHAPKDVIQELLLHSVVGDPSSATKRNPADGTRERLIRGKENGSCQNCSLGHVKKEVQDGNLEDRVGPQSLKNEKSRSHNYRLHNGFSPEKCGERNSDSKKNRNRLRKDCKDKDQARNNDRLDVTVSTSNSRLDNKHAEEENSPSALSRSRSSNFDNAKDSVGEMKSDMYHNTASGKAKGKSVASSISTSTVSDRHADSHAAAHKATDIGFPIGVVKKHSTRGITKNDVHLQKQVWVLKSSSDS